MPKYNVYIPVDAGANIEVEAESKKEAIEKAFDEGCPNLCHYCARELEVNDFSHTASVDDSNVSEVE